MPCRKIKSQPEFYDTARTRLDAGTSGMYYFDSFESRCLNYVGPMAGGGSHLALDSSLSGVAPRATQSKRALRSNAGRDHFASYKLEPPQQGGSQTFTAVADAYVAGDATTNYGTATTLRADASPDLNSYLRF